MNNLEEMLVDAVKRHSTTEAIQAVVDKQIEDIITRAVETGLRSYGDIGKQIETKIKAALQLPDLDLPSYGHMVVARMRSAMDEHLNGMLMKVMEDEMAELFKLAPKILKMEDVIEALREYAKEFDSSHRFTYEAEVDDERYSFWVHMDTQDKVSKYECNIRMLMSPTELRGNDAPPIDWYKDTFKIAAIYIDKQDAKKVQHFGTMDKWKKMLFAAYCCKTPVIMGELDPSREVHDW